MKLPQCEREAAVLAAASRGEWTDELRAHARDCAVCSDAALVAEFVAAEPAASITVPDGALIWWKAQLAARRARTRRALRPVIIAEGAAAACGLAGIVWAVAWLGSAASAMGWAIAGGLIVLCVSAASALLAVAAEK